MKNVFNHEEAETFAICALLWLIQDPTLMERFLSLSGIEASDIRNAASEPGFLAGVLQFFLGHEPTLLRFCEEIGRDPALFERAIALLPGGTSPEYQ